MNAYKNFNGSLDDFMNHCSKIDADKLESDLTGQTDTILNDEEALDCIIEEYRCDREQAKKILLEVKTEEVLRIFQKFVDMGLATIVSYDDEGLPVIQLTEIGKGVAERARKEQEQKPRD